MLSNEYFEGQENITKGNRRGNDKILPEILNDKDTALAALATIVGRKKSVFISDLQTGTGAEQDIAHTLVNDAGEAVAPLAVIPVIVNDATLAVAFVEGTHTASVIKMTAGLAQTYKVIAIY